MTREIYFFIQDYLNVHPFLIPLGIIGFWRWSVWLFKELVALKYRPEKGTYKAAVSIITPVYNEDPKIFLKALRSWEENKPKEIIAVIDYTDSKCIEVFRKFAGKRRWAKLIITRVPGKRPALATGIEKAKSEIVALVDSDTIWTEEVIKNGLSPFKNKRTAGVGTYQSVLEPKTLAQKIFDTQLDLRYCDEMPFLAASGDALTCLSGRTAFYRREIILALLPDLVNETFMGKKVISGDDKRLTYLVLEKGWRVAYQNNSRVFTPGMKDLKTYLKQRLRWTRNGIRADLKALQNGWPFKHPAFVFFQFDKFAQAMVIILSPIYFSVSLITGAWEGALAIFVWWFISRGVKIYPHLKRRPKDISILPFFVLFTFLNAVIKIYALFTLNTQGWITRWHLSRLPQVNFLKTLPAYSLTVFVLFFMIGAVMLSKQLISTQGLSPLNSEQKKQLAISTTKQVLGVKANNLAERKILGIYEIRAGDSITAIAGKFGTKIEGIIKLNAAFLPNINKIQEGLVLAIPKTDAPLPSQSQYNFQKKYLPSANILYSKKNNSIEVSGRGTRVTISQIKKVVGEDLIKEEAKGEFLLNANLHIQNGATLYLDQKEIKWLKLSSYKKKFVHLGIYNGALIIDGVKITSWDPSKNDVDKNHKDGRSYMLTNYASLINIENAEISYLGYLHPKSNETYGFSLKIPENSRQKYLLTGSIKGNRFHDNYIGAYTSGGQEIYWGENRFYHNVSHGLHFDSNSQSFTIEDNLVYGNGKNGILLSNKSSYHTVLGNEVYDNTLYGIEVTDSERIVLKQNKLRLNNIGIVLSHTESNDIEENKVLENDIGIRLEEAHANNIHKNSLKYNRTGVYFSENSSSNKFVANSITNNHLYKIFAKKGNKDNLFVE